MRTSRILLCLAIGALVALPLMAQGNPTARVSGTVVSADGQALPGATVTFQSPNLQGSRVVVTGANGNYSSPPLPPGEYEITFQLEGFQTVTKRVRLSAAQSVDVNTTLELESVAEEIVVTGEAIEVISEGTTSAQTITREELEHLPVARNLENAVALSAGVHTTGPGGNISINGAQSWENLFLLNGVTLNENIRGQPFDLFIEDAIQETTTATSGVSAEFGRFTGGVVNAITKSGGNQFSGSLRTSFDNDDWTAETPETSSRTNEINETFEATFGGPILRDRIWFFLAGRDRETESTFTTRFLRIPVPQPFEEERVEGKLTFALTKSHQLQVSALEIDEFQGNNLHGGLGGFGITVDDGSADDRELPQDLLAANYTGIITPNFFVEAQYSEREFTFAGSGGNDQSLNGGTPIWDFVNGVIYNESLFCGVCRDEERDNENKLAKGSYFLSTANAGSHDFVFGYDTFEDIRAADNHQSPNDLMIWNFAESVIDTSTNQVFPVWIPASLAGGVATSIEFLPILNETQGTSFVTNSAYVNDRWRLNDQWSFNIGLRWDESDFDNSLGQPVVQSDQISPRLGATYRPSIDSPWQFNATAGTYVGQIPNTQGNASSPAGVPAQFEFFYDGPPVNLGLGPGDPGLIGPEQALDILYNWFFGVCPNALDDPFGCPLLFGVDIPGATTLVDDSLDATAADEFTIGFTRQLGTRGAVRADFIYREWGDIFATKTDLTTGKGSTDAGAVFDQGLLVNDDSALERDYTALNVLFNYSFLNNRLRLGGNYTLSEAEGNFNGETGGSGPVSSGFLSYPEYKEQEWNNPIGKLGVDQTHRARAWAIFDIFRTQRNYLNVSLLQNYFSGSPFSAAGDIQIQQFVNNPGYETPPSDVTYFFSDRGAFETDDVTRTDLSFNYSLNFGRFEVFFQPEVLNLFDEESVTGVNTSIITAVNTGPTSCNGNPCQAFNPFTTEPVEGVHWVKGSNFGEPTSDGSFQLPRTYRFSVGFRF